MESEESLLKPCKSLPPPFKDQDALQNRTSPHLGSISPHNDKDKESATNSRKDGPLQLLDLPLDILKDIFKEVTHTSDLCSLAASNSALHAVATPLIYCRFDIVWPETHNQSEHRIGVDALTYGLATLVMREDLFEHDMLSHSRNCGASCQRYACKHCGAVNLLNQTNSPVKHRRSRRGNYFSQFTKKFSLGNGPSEWVTEYSVTKESGKMLGTLVALSVARMPNLESFVWDMPTGILKDIWIALSSLGDYQSPKLEKLWVRLHDNGAASSEAQVTQTNTAPQPTQATPAQTQYEFRGFPRLVLAKIHREEPNFSIMPPLRSLTVLAIDEIAYLEEMSVLLDRSLDKLRELRIGFAPTLYSSCNDREKPPLKYVINGGPLPLLMSKIYDYSGDLETLLPKPHAESEQLMKRSDDAISEDASAPPPTFTASTLSPNMTGAGLTSNESNDMNHEPFSGLPESKVPMMNMDAIDPALFEEGAHEGREMSGAQSEPGRNSLGISPDAVEQLETNTKSTSDHRSPTPGGLREIGPTGSTASHTALRPARRLKLETLEIEKVTLQIALYKAIDWTILKSLTLLNCGDTENLWSYLQETYPPRKTLVVSMPMECTKKRGSQHRLRRMPSSEALSKNLEYPLGLRKIHTDHVSPALISFLKHALAPDSLEWLFLQDSSMHRSSVSLDAIYRGPLRRHRSSLTKVMIDSAFKEGRTHGVTYRKWILTREVLTFISSGKMSRLRELGMTIQYKDWHFFLQRLPQISHLRALYILSIADHHYGNSLNVKDFAMSAIDVVALRPEVQLCYLGIKEKCFEILETRGSKRSTDGAGSASANAGGGETDDDDDAEGHHSHDEDDSDSDDDESTSATPTTQTQGTDSDIDPVTDDDESDPVSSGTKIKLKLREILFYEDRISIFKARHGRL